MEIISTVTVNELLETYPALQETLVTLNPQFNKLKNPLLRKTMGRVATLKQAANVAGIPEREFINHLRIAVGQKALSELSS